MGDNPMPSLPGRMLDWPGTEQGLHGGLVESPVLEYISLYLYIFKSLENVIECSREGFTSFESLSILPVLKSL